MRPYRRVWVFQDFVLPGIMNINLLLRAFVSPLGLTGHTEVVQVIFSAQEVSLEEMLKRFWENHDPTQGSSPRTYKPTNPKVAVKSARPKGHRVY